MGEESIGVVQVCGVVLRQRTQGDLHSVFHALHRGADGDFAQSAFAFGVRQRAQGLRERGQAPRAPADVVGSAPPAGFFGVAGGQGSNGMHQPQPAAVSVINHRQIANQPEREGGALAGGGEGFVAESEKSGALEDDGDADVGVCADFAFNNFAGLRGLVDSGGTMGKQGGVRAPPGQIDAVLPRGGSESQGGSFENLVAVVHPGAAVHPDDPEESVFRGELDSAHRSGAGGQGVAVVVV